MEINANFKNNFYSNTKSPNICAIVSRYYEVNSYTSGSSDDSLVYTHLGDPVTLSNFNVKILNPAKEVAKNLGANTSVFLQIISA